MKKKILAFLLILIFLSINMSISYADDIEDDTRDDNLDEIMEASASLEEKEINLNSRIAVVFDRTSGRVVWGKNESKRTAMASTTKIMTAIVTVEKCDLNEIVEISSKAACTGGSRLGLKKGDKINLNDLLYGLMLRSGNDAAVAIAEHVGGSVEGFAELMNEKVKQLNLKDTNFVTPHGLDNPEHYTTATELAKIADYALKNETFRKIVSTKSCCILLNGQSKSINNTNELLGYIPEVYGVKTGFTNNAGRCLVTAIKKQNMDLITIVIQADTKKDRTKDSINLINYICNNYETVNVKTFVDEAFEKWCDVNKKRMLVNKARSDEICIDRQQVKNQSLILPKGQSSIIRASVDAIYKFEAPVRKNEIIGELRVFVGDELIEVDKIYFFKEIGRKNIYDFLKQCFMVIR